jgi:H+/Cl- antiporter ClcA/CBS domain-containing protein
MSRPDSQPRFQSFDRGQLGDFTMDGRVLSIIVLAVVVGSLGAMAAWVLLKLIALVTNIVWQHRISTADISPASTPPGVWMAVAPALGGLIIGLMARFGSEKIRGHGIPEAIEAILIGRSRMSLKVAVLKPLSSAISIGSGGPFGAEGPIIMTGGALGSLFAQCLDLSDTERKTLLVAGAAAGMTAIFGTPVAAVMLAVELLLFEWKPRSLLPVIAAVLVCAAWRPLLFAPEPLFPMSTHTALPWWGLFACIGAGVIAGLQSGATTKLLYAAEDLFERLPIHWMWWPMLGGLAVGLGALVEPRALGVGYDVIRDLLSGHMQLAPAAELLAVKTTIWVLALASGTSGGVLAPLLILGGLVGWLEGQILPGGGAFWALLGMAAMMGGTMRAPFTAVLFAVELTGSLDMLLPLLAATSAAYAVTVLLLKRSMLTEKLARRGQHLTREYAVDPFHLLRVADVMVKEVDTLPASMTAREAMTFFTTGGRRHKSYPVVSDEGELVAIVARADVLRWQTAGGNLGRTLEELLGNEPVAVAYPDQILSEVADMMIERDFGRIPVIERTGAKIVGLMARKDLLNTRSRLSAAEDVRTRYFTPPAYGIRRAAAGSANKLPPN